MVVPELVEGH